jgi:hypothetical protein
MGARHPCHRLHPHVAAPAHRPRPTPAWKGWPF